MTLQNEFLNRVRDLVNADIYKGQAGTGNTLPTANDTELETPVASTLLDVSVASSDKALSITHTIPATTANGNILSEWEIQVNSGNQQLNRVVTAGINKTASAEVTKLTIIYFEGA